MLSPAVIARQVNVYYDKGSLAYEHELLNCSETVTTSGECKQNNTALDAVAMMSPTAAQKPYVIEVLNVHCVHCSMGKHNKELLMYLPLLKQAISAVVFPHSRLTKRY